MGAGDLGCLRATAELLPGEAEVHGLLALILLLHAPGPPGSADRELVDVIAVEPVLAGEPHLELSDRAAGLVACDEPSGFLSASDGGDHVTAQTSARR
jgi:hypothetical protein